VLRRHPFSEYFCLRQVEFTPSRASSFRSWLS
jgi:hypothetical protein